jgi:hypothetical protein
MHAWWIGNGARPAGGRQLVARARSRGFVLELELIGGIVGSERARDMVQDLDRILDA